MSLPRQGAGGEHAQAAAAKPATLPGHESMARLPVSPEIRRRERPPVQIDCVSGALQDDESSIAPPGIRLSLHSPGRESGASDVGAAVPCCAVVGRDVFHRSSIVSQRPNVELSCTAVLPDSPDEGVARLVHNRFRNGSCTNLEFEEYESVGTIRTLRIAWRNGCVAPVGSF